ncbi:transporter substrate-binding domain-containing protein [uncultured Desulfosarcina sp.]|uniref:substrate-binding periplasmic protein n=1 Tax=uncultured Desulfosarcina sp. TaxID=218289 RepID=UPI0029C81708|nr:transporter substrate-binding domain-containing protein [uncultured Desulfosarcina sp.]
MTKQNQMRPYIVCIWCFVIWTCGITITEAQQSTEEPTILKIGTMELPPYGWENSQHEKHGIIYELNQEIGIRSGFSFTNNFLPHNRMYKLLKDEEIDLISSQAHQAAQDAGDKLAVQFNINVIAATRKGSGIQKIEDFKGRNLIYHYSASYPQLDGLPRNIQQVKSYRQSLKILYSRSYNDGAVLSEPAYYYWMQEMGLTPDDFGKVIMIERNKEQWIFVRKGLPQETRMVLKRVVETIYRENLYGGLLKKYGKN